jgi:hypothetical protein
MRSLYPIGNEFSSNDIEVPLGGGEQSITAFEVVAAKDTQEEDNKCALLPEPRKRLELLHIPKIPPHSQDWWFGVNLSCSTE